MGRRDDLDRFYGLLKVLETRGGERLDLFQLKRNSLPDNGLCLYYQEGETRDDNRTSRVVRVRCNYTQKTHISMYKKLICHRGTIAGKYAGGGNHRDSLLRKYIGSSLINRDELRYSDWEAGKSNARTRKTEHSMEVLVSQELKNFSLVIVPLPEEGDCRNLAKYLERECISLLSNFMRTVIDGPSDEWLGKYCSNELVSESGLWNTSSVMDQHHPEFLDLLEKIIMCATHLNSV